jgi:hypothetical protein
MRHLAAETAPATATAIFDANGATEAERCLAAPAALLVASSEARRSSARQSSRAVSPKPCFFVNAGKLDPPPRAGSAARHFPHAGRDPSRGRAVPCADREHDARERSTAERDAPSASLALGCCKHESSGGGAGALVAGVGHEQSRRRTIRAYPRARLRKPDPHAPRSCAERRMPRQRRVSAERGWRRRRGRPRGCRGLVEP